jgi:putative transposase
LRSLFNPNCIANAVYELFGSIFCNNETQEDLHRLKINRVRIVRRADGYYAQFCFDAERGARHQGGRKEQGEYSGNVVGLDLGLKFFTKDQNDNAVIYPQFLRKSERKLKKAARRLSKKFVKGAKPQSNNYHKARKRLGRVHLKIQRQRKDWAIKQARCVVHSNDVVVYENLQIANMVKNHHLANSSGTTSRLRTSRCSPWTLASRMTQYSQSLWQRPFLGERTTIES